MTENPPLPDSDRRTDRLCLLFLLAVNTFLYRRILFLGEIPGGNDLQYQYFAWKHFFITSLQEGVFPFWNPYVFAGAPVIHEILAACFHPFDWLFLFIPIPWGFGLSYWFHLTLGAFLFYWLAGEFLPSKPARLLAATAYMLSAPILTRMGEGVPTLNQTYAVLPLFFLVGKRLFEHPTPFRLGAFAWVSALFIYAGHPQIPFMALQLLLGWILLRSVHHLRTGGRLISLLRPFTYLVLAGSLGLAMAGPQAFPFLEYASFSATRAGGAVYSFAAEGSLPPPHLITSALPFFFGDPTDRSYWKTEISYHETCGYLGAFTLFLCLCWMVLPRRRGGGFWLAVILLSILLAMGMFTPVHRLFYEFVPGWDRFRQPARSFYILAFAGSLLAGLGLQSVAGCLGGVEKNSLRRLIGGLLALLLVIAGVIGWTILSRDRFLAASAEEMNLFWRAGSGLSENRYQPDDFIHRYTGRVKSLSVFAVWVGVFGVWLMALLRFEAHRPRLIWAAPVLLALDLLLFGSRFLVSYDREAWKQKYYPDSELMASMSDTVGEGRLAITDNSLHWMKRELHPELYPNGPLYYRVRSIRGYNPTILRHYSAFINLIQGAPLNQNPGGLLFLNNLPSADPLGLRVLGVRHLVEWNRVGPPYQPDRKLPSGLLVYRFDEGLPRGFRALAADNAWELEPMDRDRDRTRILASDCNSITFETEADIPSRLVFNDCWFPGWEATVNGAPAEIDIAFVAFQSVEVPAGKSVVTWRFRPLFWNTYLLIAGLSALLATFLLFLRAPSLTQPAEPPAAPPATV